jgi:hypothetical protein
MVRDMNCATSQKVFIGEWTPSFRAPLLCAGVEARLSSTCFLTVQSPTSIHRYTFPSGFLEHKATTQPRCRKQATTRPRKESLAALPESGPAESPTAVRNCAGARLTVLDTSTICLAAVRIACSCKPSILCIACEPHVKCC